MDDEDLTARIAEKQSSKKKKVVGMVEGPIKVRA